MAFSDQEIWRIKAELGYNLLESGAEAYVSIVSLFDVIVQEYIEAEVATTSSTAVTASTTPSPTTLTLAVATGFSAGQRCVIDVDAREEVATLQYITGTSATYLLSLTHSGTYPVVIEGPITIARQILNKIASVKEEISSSAGYGALKQVDEIQFYQSGTKTYLGNLGNNLRFWRNELSSVLSVPNLWERRGGAVTSLSAY